MNFFNLFNFLYTADHAQILFILRQDQIEYLHPWPQGWVKAPQLFQSCMVIFGDSLTLRQEERLLVLNWHSYAIGKVFFLHHNLESMQVLTLPNIKALFSRLVGDTVPHFRTKHEMLAHHVIIHDIFDHRDAIFRVEKVKVYVVVGNDLQSDIASDGVYEASRIEQVVLHPNEFIGVVVLLPTQKENERRTSSDEHPVLIQVHVTEVLNWCLLEASHPVSVHRDGGDLTLAKDGVDLVGLIVPEGLLWEVDVGAVFDMDRVFGLFIYIFTFFHDFG